MVHRGNHVENWRVFKEAYNGFATATEIIGKKETMQVTNFKARRAIDLQVVKVFNGLCTGKA